MSSQIPVQLVSMLESSKSEGRCFPATLLYCEGWLLRFILDWFSKRDISDHPLAFFEGSRWFSEALLPSAFLPRREKDPLAESHTHADGVIGHFSIAKEGKAFLTLLSDAKHFVVLEAKIYSPLSPGVKNASYYDQAARNVACIAEVLSQARRLPTEMSHLAFYVIAPLSQIKERCFTEKTDVESIVKKVERRIKEYNGEKDKWYQQWFKPTIENLEIATLDWETIIDFINDRDSLFGLSIREFYDLCLRFNQKTYNEKSVD